MARILVVDDDPTNRALLMRFLEHAGHDVRIARDGGEALVRAWRDHPALILLDLSMPIFDGWATARQLKASPETRAIPIIAVTAHALPADRERALAAGCDDYATKPLNLARLSAQIAAWLPR